MNHPWGATFSLPVSGSIVVWMEGHVFARLSEGGAEGAGEDERVDEEEAGEIEVVFEEVRVTVDVDARVRLPRTIIEGVSERENGGEMRGVG